MRSMIPLFRPFVRSMTLGVALSLVLTPSSFADDAEEAAERARLESLPMTVPDFRLVDTRGGIHTLADYEDAEALVLFMQMNGCPIVRQSYPYLKEIREEFDPKGVEFLYVNSNRWDTPEIIEEERADYLFEPPVLVDEHRALAMALDVKRSAEVFVIDPKSREILYRGMADDRFDYGLQRMSPDTFWLHDALTAHLAAKTPDTRRTIAKGCLLDMDLFDDVTYDADVAPLIDAKLPGLDGKEDALGVLLTGRYHDEPVDLSEEDAEVLLSWIYATPSTG